jgi:hypothetical protein
LELVVFLKGGDFGTEWGVSVEAKEIGTGSITPILFSLGGLDDYLSLGSMATSHDNSSSISWAIRYISG